MNRFSKDRWIAQAQTHLDQPDPKVKNRVLFEIAEAIQSLKTAANMLSRVPLQDQIQNKDETAVKLNGFARSLAILMQEI